MHQRTVPSRKATSAEEDSSRTVKNNKAKVDEKISLPSKKTLENATELEYDYINKVTESLVIAFFLAVTIRFVAWLSGYNWDHTRVT